LDAAIERYQQSIALHPTAEAHTFLGWTYSFQGRLEDAIAQCKEAIAVDPDFGNPYNDIGSYLIKLGRLDEAVPWLESAIKAPRYEPRHYPHCNLGQVYWAQGLLAKAAGEFERALAIEPEYPYARAALATLAYLAGATTRVGLGTAVLVLPYRPALPTAKWIATVQELSGGRLLLGVGVGWMAAEFRAVGVDLRRRGAVTDATLAFLDRCFAADVVEANGQPFLFRPRPPRPPLFIGGAPPHAFRPALAHGAGRMPIGLHPDALRPLAAEPPAPPPPKGPPPPRRA